MENIWKHHLDTAEDLIHPSIRRSGLTVSDRAIWGAARSNFQLDGLWVTLRPGCTLLPTLCSAGVDGCRERGSHCRRCAKCLGEPFEERLDVGAKRIQRGKLHVFMEWKILEKMPQWFQRNSFDLYVYCSFDLTLKCFFHQYFDSRLLRQDLHQSPRVLESSM